MTAAVRFAGVTKRFPGVVALNDVSFEIERGTCHALCGENGAGKSTLGKLLSGIHRLDGGAIELFGTAVKFEEPSDALAAGVAMVHQELAFCENMTVAENLSLGRIPTRNGFVDRTTMRARARELLGNLESPSASAIDVMHTLRDLTIAQRQLIQIAAAIGSGANILVFDEPTSSLSEREADHLYHLIGELTARGVTVVYVSHRMHELFRLCHTITVLRDGRHVATQPASEMTERDVVRLMVGRAVEGHIRDVGPASDAPEALRVEGLHSPGKFAPLSFSVRSGEILGLAGLVGAGRSQVVEAVFGLDKAAKGTVYVDGKLATARTPRAAMGRGIGLVPEDRKRQGLVLGLGGRENTTLPILERLSALTFVRGSAERQLTTESFERLRVKASTIDTVTATLSGGNQQKIVLAKWLAAKCRVLLLDEPTRGVDVGAKAEIHALIDALAREGAAVVLVSSEMPELLQLADRILVMREGRMVTTLSRGVDQDTVLRWMAGVEAAA